MSKERKKLSVKAGLPPGSLVYTGAYHKEIEISLYQFSEETFEEYRNISMEEIKKVFKPELVNWIDVCGISDAGKVQEIGTYFEIHPLALEDIMDVNHLPKVEETGKHLFIILKSLEANNNFHPEMQQISLLLGKSYLISFRDKESDIFKSVIERIKASVSKARSKQEDYLFYMLIDKIVDEYYAVIENIDDEIEDLEDDLINKPSENLSQRILDIKKRFIVLKKFIYPLRDELRKTLREELKMINEPTRAYLSDIYDHLLQISQTMDLFRDMIAGLLELHLSNNDLRMNRIMTRLTVVATVFIPMTFLVGLYGMNLKMPEYSISWFYPFLWVIMIVSSGLMFLYMKKKKWF